jgi:hypothetical protein
MRGGGRKVKLEGRKEGCGEGRKAGGRGSQPERLVFLWLQTELGSDGEAVRRRDWGEKKEGQSKEWKLSWGAASGDRSEQDEWAAAAGTS